jgi:hypothetical protein
MAKKSLEDRVSVIEVQLAGKTLEEHFRAQAELIDQRFATRDIRLGRLERDVMAMKVDVRSLKIDVSALKIDVAALKNDMVIVREGIGILLKKLN